MTPAQVHALAEIQQHLARCTQAGDARKARTYAECFTTDGVLELAHQTITGREAIHAWMTAPSVIPPPANGAPGFVSHHLTTCHVEFGGPDEATARTYWLVTSAAGIDHNGFYLDRLQCRSDQWLIAHRKPRTLWVSPTSVLHQS
ncbi:nuclear transport factor 2 family protein [Novosphingobium guangzhouense]|uniref:SnoaL-like domain-containing protein n=1 Tax=Novosphingobium guangzhouense TaxID=1850347 RepID=A0A2K2FZB2_9SPHN|nr:nuclear transport factor 2 family protein [Novosphingobium guangzhouense]PNU04129.1 hypothetical protein A8V01_05920 [Novosphingobium guangzhouense]